MRTEAPARPDVDRSPNERPEHGLERLREQIAQTLSHELLTPLLGILGFAELIEADARRLEPDEIADMARRIRESGGRLHRMIRNSLLLSQLSLCEGREPDPHEPTEVFDLAPWVENRARVGAQSANREADLILELETVFARASAEHVVKIVDELVDNALKFSGPGAAVRVSLAPCAGHAVLRIADSGRGMASEHVTAIAPHVQFERGRFEQQGAGLGLTIARRLAELHGGNLTLFSAVDAGTVVEVRIPVASASPLHALSGHA